MADDGLDLTDGDINDPSNTKSKAGEHIKVQMTFNLVFELGPTDMVSLHEVIAAYTLKNSGYKDITQPKVYCIH